MITIVVGAQFGGEGKGKISAFLHNKRRYDVVCRCGGVNSSHTVHWDGGSYRFRMLPTSVVFNDDHRIVFGAGTLLHINTLMSEIGRFRIDFSRVLIDPQAGIITEDCIQRQREDQRYQSIGSTLTGTGYASADRALRRLPIARDFPILAPMISDTKTFLYKAAKRRENILIEGHQGAMLSNYHGDYPYTSSRDSTAAAMLSELGMGLKWKYETVLVLKTFSTRNHAGNLPNELTPKHAEKIGIVEYGGGSWGVEDKRRRVGSIDFEIIAAAIRMNTPAFLAVTALDYMFPNLHGLKDASKISNDARHYISSLENSLGVKVGVVSSGKHADEGFFYGPCSETSRHPHAPNMIKDRNLFEYNHPSSGNDDRNRWPTSGPGPQSDSE